MVLNAYGQIVYDQWLWLGRNFSFIRLDEFTVMPDHFHGILEIIDMDPVGTVRDCRCGSRCRCNPRVTPTNGMDNQIYSRRYNLLSKTMNAFKTTSSKKIHQAGLIDFKWQKSFYDHIIRDDESLDRIRFYIKNYAIHHSR
jgi:REP element-mobilizing transposase RayT